MVFTGRPFSAAEMFDCDFVNSVVPRADLETEVAKYANACANNMPTDTIFMQKTFFNIMRQQQGEYLGSMLSAWLESMTGALKADVDNSEAGLAGKIMDGGVNNMVKNNDNRFPPEWRLSRSGREQPPAE
jgi:enoyl-CoA hydratase/carnithine racemase